MNSAANPVSTTFTRPSSAAESKYPVANPVPYCNFDVHKSTGTTLPTLITDGSLSTTVGSVVSEWTSTASPGEVAVGRSDTYVAYPSGL